jgi:Mg2+ and Co2+ transporter CorA
MHNLALQMDTKSERVKKLDKFITVLKSDRMNNTLYVLTLVTAFAIPLDFWVGLGGLNWDEDVALLEETNWSGGGYNFFWILTLGTLFIVFLGMNRMGFFLFLLSLNLFNVDVCSFYFELGVFTFG